MPVTTYNKGSKHHIMHWVVPNLLPSGNLTIASGEPNVGKSRFWTQAGWMLSVGETIFWPKIDPIKVLLCSERRACEVHEQMRFLGIPFDVANPNFRLLTIGDMGKAEAAEMNRDPLATLQATFKDFKPDVGLMDTLGHFLVTTEMRGAHNVNDYGSTLLRIRTFNQWCHQWDLALVGVHHMRKQTVNDASLRIQDRTLGSQAIVGGSGQIWSMESLTDENLKTDVRYIKLSLSIHYRPWREPIYLKTGIDLPFEVTTQQEALEANLDPSDGLVTAPLQGKVVEALPNGGTPIKKYDLVTAVSKAVGCDPHNVYKAIKSLAKKGKLTEIDDPETGQQFVRIVVKQ